MTAFSHISPRTALLLGIDNHAVGLSAALAEVLRVAEGAEFAVPVGFEGVGDQAVGRIDVQVALAGGVGLVLGALDLELAKAIGLIEPRLDLPMARR